MATYLNSFSAPSQRLWGPFQAPFPLSAQSTGILHSHKAKHNEVASNLQKHTVDINTQFLSCVLTIWIWHLRKNAFRTQKDEDLNN